MVRLLVIADDFTGALDTGVQFHAADPLVLIYTGREQDVLDGLRKDAQVMIVDAETRHLKPAEAYRIVYQITEAAIKHGVSYIYKKTDSGLRGNIGSELTAFLEASGGKRIHFIPAFPKMGRTTRNGIHYIDEVPVSESMFGKDPFDPVTKSAVNDIIAAQSDAPVHIVKQGDGSGALGALSGIFVHDSASEEEMLLLGERLKEKGELHLVAGCAGFASILVQLLELKTQDQPLPEFPEEFLVICGSINAVTTRQLDYAAENGVDRAALTLAQKLSTDWIESGAEDRLINEWVNRLQLRKSLIIECGVNGLQETQNYIKAHGLTQENARKQIADSMGCILKRLLDKGIRSTLLVTGGDTLLAFMQRIETNTLSPVCELSPGVVLSKLFYGGKTYHLISKSGGFGQDDLLVKLMALIRQGA